MECVGVMKPFPFQEVGIRFLAQRQSALLADEQGLGKTIQAALAIKEIKARHILIVCPAGLKLNWKRELETWVGGLDIQIMSGRKDTVRASINVLIVNYDLLISEAILSQVLKFKFAVGVFDEAHYLKTRSARRTKAVLLKGGVASRCVYKWFLTGTPVLNRPVELYPLLKACAPEVIDPFVTYESFARRYCGGFFDGFQFMAKGATNTEDLNQRLTKNFMLRRLKKDVLKELPDKLYQIIDVEVKDAKTKRLIAQEFNWSKQEVAYQKDLATGGAELALLRHELAREKVPAAIEHIKDLLEEVTKVVIFGYHKDVIEGLKNGLEAYNPVVISGDTASNTRQAVVDQFQTDPKTRVFIGQITAAGTGITLTAASTVVFVETSWVPGEIAQAEDRCHRIGQKDSVLVQFLVFSGTMEEHMLRTVVDKKRTIEKIVDERDPEFLFS